MFKEALKKNEVMLNQYRSLIKLLLFLSLFLALGFLALYFLFELGLKQQFAGQIKQYLSKQAKVKIDFADINFSFSKLLLLKPSLSVTGIKLDDFASADKAFIELSLASILKRQLTVSEIIISNAKFNFYPSGYTNPIKFTDVNLKLNNLNINDTDKLAGDFECDAKMFGSKSSKLVYKGVIGPTDLAFKTLGTEGDLHFNLYIRDMPLALRQEQFGNLFLAPGANDQVAFNAKVKGDILQSLSGSGTLIVDNIRLGKNNKRYFQAFSHLPVNFDLSPILSQALNLAVNAGKLELQSSNGRYKGVLNLNIKTFINLATEYASHNISMNLANLDINEALSAFTPVEDKVGGFFNVNNCALSFSGKNTQQMMKTLKGSGSMEIKDGTLYLLEELMKYKNMIDQVLTSSELNSDQMKLNKKENKFASLKSDFSIADSRFYNKNLLIKSPIADIQGDGNINLDNQALSYNIKLLIPKIPVLPIKIKGSIDKPAIKASLPDINQQQAEQLVNTLLKLAF